MVRGYTGSTSHRALLVRRPRVSTPARCVAARTSRNDMPRHDDDADDDDAMTTPSHMSRQFYKRFRLGKMSSATHVQQLQRLGLLTEQPSVDNVVTALDEYGGLVEQASVYVEPHCRRLLQQLRTEYATTGTVRLAHLRPALHSFNERLSDAKFAPLQLPLRNLPSFQRRDRTYASAQGSSSGGGVDVLQVLEYMANICELLARKHLRAALLEDLWRTAPPGGAVGTRDFDVEPIIDLAARYRLLGEPAPTINELYLQHLQAVARYRALRGDMAETWSPTDAERALQRATVNAFRTLTVHNEQRLLDRLERAQARELQRQQDVDRAIDQLADRYRRSEDESLSLAEARRALLSAAGTRDLGALERYLVEKERAADEVQERAEMAPGMPLTRDGRKLCAEACRRDWRGCWCPTTDKSWDWCEATECA